MRQLTGLAAIAVGMSVTGIVIEPPGPASADQIIVVPPTPVTADPNTANQLAYTFIEPADRTERTWNGNLQTCTPGQLLPTDYDLALGSINAIRAISGLDPVQFDATKSAHAQAGALILAANNQLSHTPPSSWRCWTPEGYDGTSHGNMWTGPYLSSLNWMVDVGPQHTSVGHRRWVINPYETTMGYGGTNNYEILYVVGDEDPTNTAPEWQAWPPPGYLPVFLNPVIGPLTLSRWSLGARDPATDFGGASVSVRESSGSALPVDVHPFEGGIGYNTLAFDVNNLPEAEDLRSPATYTVTVTGIQRGGATLAPVTYTVTLLPNPPLTLVEEPMVTGKLNTGEVLKISKGKWSPSGGSAYQWLRNGRPIRNGSGNEYRLVKDDEGRTISVRVTADRSKFAPTSIIVTTAGPVTRGRLRALSGAQIGFDRAQPRYLHVYGPRLSIPTKRITYVWTRNGDRIATTKKPLLLVKGKYASGRFQALVIAKARGYGKVKVLSKPFKLR